MGAGKTSVGQELSRLLGWDFVDLDARIAEGEQMPIAEIFERRGETYFRQLEAHALQACIAAALDGSPLVLAVGGGAIMDPRNRDLIRASTGRVFHLQAPVDVLWARCQEQGAVRPLAVDLQAFRERQAQREPIYSISGEPICAHNRSVSEVAREIQQRSALTQKEDV